MAVFSDLDELYFLAGCEATHPGCRGGQHVAKPCTGVRVEHVRLGVAVTVTSERSQMRNRETAVRLLRAAIEAL